MRNLITFLILLTSLVSLSQNGKYKITVRKGNSDSVYYVNDIETVRKLMSDKQKLNSEIKKRNLEIESRKLNKNLNLKLVEQEFNKLYVNYIDIVFKIKKEYGDFLDSMAYCQLNYLTNLNDSNITITHVQNNGKFKTPTERFDYFGEIHGSNSYAEILVSVGEGSNEKMAADIMFHALLSSKPHKKIMDDKELGFYNFKFGYNKFGFLIGIGVFSNTFIFLKKTT